MNVKKVWLSLLFSFALATLLIGSPLQVRAVSTSTTTTLKVTKGATIVTSVTSGSVVTLTATVKAGTNLVQSGQVNFCDAAAAHCTDIHLLGVAQLTSAGTAALKLVPGVGTHSYKAVFLATTGLLKSTSANSSLSVTGKSLTSTTVSQSGIVDNYGLTATVIGQGATAPTGQISFLDASNANASLTSATLIAGASGFHFLNPPTPATGSQPDAMAVGDFNGDGKPDLAIANYADNSVTILLGNGDGTFTAAPSSPATGLSPISLAVGDFNADGIADLVVLNNGDDTLKVLLGNGDGTFTATGSPIATGVNPLAVAVGDFNGDGKADLVVANYTDNCLTVLLGNGDGTFTGTTPCVVTGGGPAYIAVGDFNNDGTPDLAVANNTSNNVTILLGQGDGTFVAASTSPLTGNYPNALVVADFAGNGKADLAVVNSGDDTVTVLLGHGDGTFAPGTTIATGVLPYFVAVGDLNGDGIPDLAVTNDSDNTVTLLLGSGNGTFTISPTTPATGVSPWPIAIADFNGDGVVDIAVANFTDASVTVLLSGLQEATATASGIAVTGIGPHHVYASYSGDSSNGASISGTTDLYASAPVPQFSPVAGTYTAVQSVSISSLAGASIYYTTDSSVPTTASTPYTGPITVSANETITAIATASGYGTSAPASASYTINLPPAASPVFSVPSGVYSTSKLVSITDATSGAKIYFTTDGTLPTLASAVYSGPITVASTETITASAISSVTSMSAPAIAQYTIVAAGTPFIYNFAGNGTAGFRGDAGRATDAVINNPFGPAFDKTGNLYFADSINNRVRKIAAGTGIITTVAGIGTSGFSGDGAAATSAQLNGPTSVAFDSTGNLYIADTNNQVVRRVDSQTGFISTYAGNGTAGYTGDGQAATSAEINNVKGIAVDGADNVYLADSGNNRIRMVAAGTEIISTVAGSGFAGYAGDGTSAINAALNAPSGVSFDRSGNLLIADTSNNAIRKVTNATGFITTLAGDSSGIAGNAGDGGPATSARLNAPTAVAVDSTGNVYIADSLNALIRKVNASNQSISTFAGDGSICTPVNGDGGLAASAGFCKPTGVVVDSSSNVYIADSNSQRIRVVTSPALPMTAVTAAPVFTAAASTYPNPQTVTVSAATPGASIYITMDGSTPTALSPGYNGPINVSGNVTIQALSIAPGYLPSAPVTAQYTISSPPVSVISTIAGDGVNASSGLGGPAVNAEFGYLQGLTRDAAGNLYLSDIVNNEVLTISAQTGAITLVAGNGTSGYSGDGALATNASLNYPSGLAVDPAGNVYIADSSNCVIRLVTASSGAISTFAGSGQCGYAGDGSAATAAQLNYPSGVALDSAGNLYIADGINSAVRMVTASTGVISTVVGDGTYADSGDGGPAASAQVQEPVSLAFDGSGNFYIAEQNGRIRRVDAATAKISTVAGNGDMGYSGDNGPAKDAEISAPTIALDQAGNLYITSQPGAVRMVSASTGIITPVAGTGFPGFSGDGGSATVAELNEPAGIVVDKSGNLFIADANNYRIRKVVFPPAAALPVFSLATGRYGGTQSVAITDATAGSVIYYTTDGSTPTTNSAVYSGPLSVSSSETISAIAVASGLVDSPVATASYTILAVPVITWTAPAAITYGQPLTSTQLDATASVPGTFAYTPAASTVLSAGTQTLSVTFTPTDQATYITTTSTVQITVNQATPAITWATPAAITYGTALSATQLNASSATPGTFAYTPASGTVLGAGPQTLSATFTPTDATDYTTATTTVQLTVNKATPVITWASPASITYGTALSATQLNASSAAAGTFAYTPASGVVLGAGPQTLSVTFTPTDATDYTTATTTVQLTVNKATPSITWASPAAITYGTALSATQLNASSVTAGMFAYTPASGTVLGAGPQTLSVTFTPTDATNYASATTTVQLTVNKATPSITWASPAAITYGTALSATQLNASSATVGTFAYTPASGIVLGAGPQTLSVTFTPTDATDYTTATTTVQLTVNKATPSITWASPAAITYGTALSATQLNASSATAGTFA
ncbi:MAG: FG-GAP-like repeat-containing protein, partial [Terracidiphilus sp.]|nr:FG-GAP-like repeat-containing protein [Terracidiphilus sp.]